jgi:NADH:ubiquinone oxidoreductase subunit B-like Fe-S oxidoreductase
MYLPGCPPRPEMLIDAILKLHEQVQAKKLGANRLAEIEERENAALKAYGLVEMVLFIATVFVAYAYVWRRGGLDWD